MKKYNLFLFLFASIYINAQTYTLSGKVVDANQKPLVGASIFLTQLKKGILTDFEGNFN